MFGEDGGVELFLLGVVSRWPDLTAFRVGDRPRRGYPAVGPSSNNNRD